MFYSLFSQGKAEYVAQGSNNARDKANAPLFTYVNENKLKSIATYASKYCLVFNNSIQHENQHLAHDLYHISLGRCILPRAFNIAFSLMYMLNGIIVALKDFICLVYYLRFSLIKAHLEQYVQSVYMFLPLSLNDISYWKL